MNRDNTERERIIEQAFSALTASEVRHATQELQQWTCTHPQDFGIVDTFEVLSHKQDFAKEQDQRATAREAATAS